MKPQRGKADDSFPLSQGTGWLTFNMLVLRATSSPQAFFRTPAEPENESEISRLGTFAGKWKTVGQVKPGTPAGRITARPTGSCEWTSCGFAILCRETALMPGKDEAPDAVIYGYDSRIRKYVWSQANNRGEMWIGRGVYAGDTWSWSSECMGPGKTLIFCFAEDWASPDSFTFKNADGLTVNAMVVMLDGQQTRVTPAASK